MTVATPTRAEAPADKPGPANPLLAPWRAADGAPPYDRIAVKDYPPAFEKALEEGRIAFAAIAGNPEPPGFANSIEAMEKATPLLDRVSATFFTVASADATDAVQAIEEKVTPELTGFSSHIWLDPRLYARVEAVWKQRETLGLTPEQARLLDVTHTRFIRAGAALDEAGRKRLAEIEQEMATLRVRFSQNVLADQKAADRYLTEAEMAGIPDGQKSAAAARAEAAGRPGSFLVRASRSDVENFLTLASSREARRKIFTAFNMRGDNGDRFDNNANITALLRLRLEKARLLGYASHADYVLADSMAKTPQAATELMMRVYEAARSRAAEEEADLLAIARVDGISRIEPWDWRYYAEKLRQQRYAFDEGSLTQYLPLDGMVAALFDAMHRLYGIRFVARDDVPPYADDVRVWEVRDADGSQLGLFYGDWLTRDSKRPGAWMNDIRTQNGLEGVRPIVVNNANIPPPAKGARATIALDDAVTLFHEFGHAIHSLMSKTRYPSLAGTAVYRDFVEFPSQINEHWVKERDLLAAHAVNAAGEPMPAALLEALKKSETFNQGFATVQQLSSALVDMKIHQLQAIPADFDPRRFERETLDALGVPEAVGMRHRLAHFTHVFDSGYDAGYYSYTWAEVLEADAFDAFREAGSAWDKATAERYRREILERGNSRDPAESYVAFRGRMPKPDALLRNRGLQ